MHRFGNRRWARAASLVGCLHYQYDERIGLDFSVLASACYFRRYSKELVRLGIDGHGARSLLRRHRLGDAELIAAIFLDECDRTISRRGEGEAILGIEAGRVASLSDGGTGYHFAGTSTQNYIFLIPAAAGKQAPVFPVDGEAGRLLGITHFPACFHGDRKSTRLNSS